jgi:hypothetical protein
MRMKTHFPLRFLADVINFPTALIPAVPVHASRRCQCTRHGEIQSLGILVRSRFDYLRRPKNSQLCFVRCIYIGREIRHTWMEFVIAEHLFNTSCIACQ